MILFHTLSWLERQHSSTIFSNIQSSFVAMICQALYIRPQYITSLLDFLRLVGTVYFKKHLAAFNSQYGHEAPQHRFNSIDSTVTNQERHQLWLQKIRETIAERITCEEERIPSFTALWCHWLRSCWISQLWQNSPQSDVYSQLPPPDESGWLLHQDDSYTID